MLTRFFLFIFLSLQSVFHVLTAAPVNIKFINKSSYPIRVNLLNEEDIFGLGKKAVLYASLPSDAPTSINFEAIDDDKASAFCAAQEMMGSTGSVLSASSSAYRLAEQSKAAKAVSDVFIKEIALRAQHLKGVDGAPFVEFFWNVKVTEEAIAKAAQAKQILAFGAANIAIAGVDWLCSDGKINLPFVLTPNELVNYQPGFEVVLEVTDKQVTAIARPRSEAKPTFRCVVETKSSVPLSCSFRDEDGDVCHVRLNKAKFHQATFNMQKGMTLEMREVVSYQRSFMHSMLKLSKGSLNAALAFCDPFPLTKSISALSACSDFYAGILGASDRVLARRRLLHLPLSEQRLIVADKGWYGLTIKTVELDQETVLGL